MRHHRCFAERCGGAFSGADAEENFRHTNADAAPEKESCCREKEIAHSDTNSKGDSFANASPEKENLAVAKSFTAAEEKIVTKRVAIRDAYRIDISNANFDAGVECFAAS
jgi:hypothetical protein